MFLYSYFFLFTLANYVYFETNELYNILLYYYTTFTTMTMTIQAIHGKVRFFTHLFFNYRNILDTKIPRTEPKRQIYVIRQEHLWDDWSIVNNMFGRQRDDDTDEQPPVIIPSGELSAQRNTTDLNLPVTREISDQGRMKLCKALESEYVAYFQLLQRAENMNANDLEDSRKIALRNCPNLDTRSMLRVD